MEETPVSVGVESRTPEQRRADAAREGYEFDAFVSYSTEADYALVRDLEAFLETFDGRIDRSRLPPGVTLHKLELCVDGSDFSTMTARGARAGGVLVPDDATARIWSVIESRLRRCRFLLVVCPGKKFLTEEDWPGKELAWFVEHRGADRVHLVVTRGAAPWAPYEDYFSAEVLRHGLHRNIWFDFRGFRGREARDWLKVRDFDDERTRLAAGLNGVAPGEILPLWARQRLERQRRNLFLAGVILLVLAVIAGWALIERGRARVAEGVAVGARVATEQQRAIATNEAAVARQNAARERRGRASVLAREPGSEHEALEAALAAWRAAEQEGIENEAPFEETLLRSLRTAVRAQTLPHPTAPSRMWFDGSSGRWFRATWKGAEMNVGPVGGEVAFSGVPEAFGWEASAGTIAWAESGRLRWGSVTKMEEIELGAGGVRALFVRSAGRVVVVVRDREALRVSWDRSVARIPGRFGTNVCAVSEDGGRVGLVLDTGTPVIWTMGQGEPRRLASAPEGIEAEEASSWKGVDDSGTEADRLPFAIGEMVIDSRSGLVFGTDGRQLAVWVAETGAMIRHWPLAGPSPERRELSSEAVAGLMRSTNGQAGWFRPGPASLRKVPTRPWQQPLADAGSGTIDGASSWVEVSPSVRKVEFGRGGRHLVVGYDRGLVRVFDPRRGEMVGDLPESAGGLDHLAFIPETDRLVTAGGVGGAVRVWALGRRVQLVAEFDGTGRVQDVVAAPRGERLAVVVDERVRWGWRGGSSATPFRLRELQLDGLSGWRVRRGEGGVQGVLTTTNGFVVFRDRAVEVLDPGLNSSARWDLPSEAGAILRWEVRGGRVSARALRGGRTWSWENGRIVEHATPSIAGADFGLSPEPSLRLSPSEARGDAYSWVSAQGGVRVGWGRDGVVRVGWPGSAAGGRREWEFWVGPPEPGLEPGVSLRGGEAYAAFGGDERQVLLVRRDGWMALVPSSREGLVGWAEAVAAVGRRSPEPESTPWIRFPGW